LGSTAPDFFGFRRLFVLPASALAVGGCAPIAVGPHFFVRLLGIPVVAVALQDTTFGQGRGARFRGQRTDFWLIRGFTILAFLGAFDRARALAGALRRSDSRCRLIGRRIAAPATPPSSSSSAPSPAARLAALGRPAVALLWLFWRGLSFWFALGFGRSLRIAQQPEDPRLDPYEGTARGFLHGGSELGLHGDLGGSPHKGQQFAIGGLLGEFLEVKRPALTL
jgi:hypothetical protein